MLNKVPYPRLALLLTLLTMASFYRSPIAHAGGGPDAVGLVSLSDITSVLKNSDGPLQVGTFTSNATTGEPAANFNGNLPSNYNPNLGAVPGNMGPNALPVQKIDDDSMKQIWVMIRVEANSSDKGDDIAVAPHIDLLIPFNQVVAAEFQSLPLEYFKTSPQVAQSRGATNTTGTVPGDVYAGALFNVVKETQYVPEIKVKLLVKTTTGKDYVDGRFTNAPAYLFEAILGKNVYQNADTFIQRVRLLGQAGFFAWQRQVTGQDDAVTLGAGVEVDMKDGLSATLEVDGYRGWLQGDKPAVLSLSIRKSTTHVDYVLEVDRGLDADAPDWGISFGVVFHADAPTFPL